MGNKIVSVLYKILISLAICGYVAFSQAGGPEMMVFSVTAMPTMLPVWLTVLSIDKCAAGLDCNKGKYKIAVIEEVNTYVANYSPGEEQIVQEQFLQLEYLAQKSGLTFDDIVVATLSGKLNEVKGLDKSDYQDSN